MRKRDELADPNSCLNKAKDDEWLFVLLGRDLSATAAVVAWIDDRIRIGKNHSSDPQLVEARRWIAAVLAEQMGSTDVLVARFRNALNDLLGRYQSLLENLGVSPNPEPLREAKALLAMTAEFVPVAPPR